MLIPPDSAGLNREVALSVIIPAYNAERYIERCILSVLKQAEKDFRFEIIVVDDGSSDSTFEVVKRMAIDNPQIRIIRQENRGVSVARNTGLDAAVGEYVYFIDADDFINSGFLKRLYDEANACDAEILRFGWRYAEPSTVPIDLSSIPITTSKTTGDEYLARTGADGPFGAVWTMFIRRSFLLETSIRFDSKIKIGEDNLFFIWLLPFCKTFVESNLCGYNYVIHPGSTMSHHLNASNWSRKVDGLVSLACAIKERFDSPDLESGQNQELMRRLNYSIDRKVYDAISFSFKNSCSRESIKRLVSDLKSKQLYPLAGLATYNGYGYDSMPVVRLKWMLFRNEHLLSIISKLLCQS